MQSTNNKIALSRERIYSNKVFTDKFEWDLGEKH